jgi:hypothetical protein
MEWKGYLEIILACGMIDSPRAQAHEGLVFGSTNCLGGCGCGVYMVGACEVRFSLVLVLRSMNDGSENGLTVSDA